MRAHFHHGSLRWLAREHCQRGLRLPPWGMSIRLFSVLTTWRLAAPTVTSESKVEAAVPFMS